MDSNDNYAPAPLRTPVHRLQGKALKQWWQMSSPRKADTYNPALQMLASFLISTPLCVAMLYERWPISARTGLTLLALTVWLGIFLVFLFVARRHLYHVLAVQTSEEGLEFKSLLFKRKVRWADIVDFFSAGDGEIAKNKYVLETRSGEEFLLSKELTDSNKLFELIRQRMPRIAEPYHQNFRRLDGLVDASIAMNSAIILAFACPLLKALFCGVQPGFSDWLTAIAGVLIASLIWSFHASKVTETIRASNNGLFLRTRSGGQVIPREQITNIRQLGDVFILSSRRGWFILFPDKKEPVTAKLIEYKQNLPRINQTHS